MYQWMESAARLDRYAIKTESSGAAFTVHYWGVNSRHFSNAPHKHSFFEICYVLHG